jgi:hypothetical protein
VSEGRPATVDHASPDWRIEPWYEARVARDGGSKAIEVLAPP